MTNSREGLGGLRVVTFESRLSRTLADLVRVHGGEPIEAPSMREVPIERNAEAMAFGEELLAGRVDVLILLTGVGARTLLAALETRHERARILSALSRTQLVPRGPKPVRVLREWGIEPTLEVPEPNTWKELLEALDRHADRVPLAGRRTVLQEYGVPNPQILEGLERRGAIVRVVPVYRWELPADTRPLEEAVLRVASGEADAAVFTTSIQIAHALEVAGRMGEAERFRRGLESMVVASVGPDCSEALRTSGVRVDLQPDSPKMGPLVALLAERGRSVLEAKRRGERAVEARPAGPLPAGTDPLRECLFLRACRRESVERTPVWLMRQAGRYMKEYRDIRDKTPFLDLCRDAELAARVTVEAQQKIGADAAIIFSDILVVVPGWGLELSYQKGDGPRIGRPIARAADLARLRDFDPADELGYVMDAIRLTRARLAADVPLIGFAGAPFTVASYLIEGGSSRAFDKTKAFARNEPGAWRELLEKIARTTGRYLSLQIASGAQAVQLFDSWAGALTEDEYRRWALPYSRQVFDAVKGLAPAIHFGTGTGPFLEAFAEAGGEVVGVDHRVGLTEAWRRIGPGRAIQGNLDPELLRGPMDRVRAEAGRVLSEAAGRPGHIFNLGHGVLPDTPVENVIELIRFVKTLSAR